MANAEQLGILEQGVEIWNKWRNKNPSIDINLTRANLLDLDLREIDFHCVDLQESFLSNADLSYADLSRAILNKSRLSSAKLYKANLTQASSRETIFGNGANLSLATLKGVDLTGSEFPSDNLSDIDLQEACLKAVDFSNADLRNADFKLADLTDANLSHADLRGADFRDATILNTSLVGASFDTTNFDSTNLSGAHFGNTVIVNVDFSNTKGLKEISHYGASNLDIESIKLAKGKMPLEFLRGCGLSDWKIESTKFYNPDLSNEEINKILYKIYDLRAQQSIQISPSSSPTATRTAPSSTKWKNISTPKASVSGGTCITPPLAAWKNKSTAPSDTTQRFCWCSRRIRSKATGWSTKSARPANWRKKPDAMYFARLRWMIAGKVIPGQSVSWSR